MGKGYRNTTNGEGGKGWTRWLTVHEGCKEAKGTRPTHDGSSEIHSSSSIQVDTLLLVWQADARPWDGAMTAGVTVPRCRRLLAEEVR